MSAMRVGYIGLGLMGKSIARNIHKAGFPVTVWNRSMPAVEELMKDGVQYAKSPAELAAQVDVLFTNLPDSPQVLEIVFGGQGVAQGAHPGLIFVDNSTIKPSASQEIHRRLKEVGVSALDAPVSGGDVGARNATLAIMVGGDTEALEKVMPVLQAMGKTITHIGAAGAGQTCKAANQIMVSSQMVAMAELLVFSEKCGVDPEKVVSAIKGGAASCWALDVKAPRLFEGNREPGFKSSMQHKDLSIIMDTSKEFGVPLPTTAVNTQLYQSMIQQGVGDLDHSAVVHVLEHLGATHIRESNKKDPEGC